MACHVGLTAQSAIPSRGSPHGYPTSALPGFGNVVRSAEYSAVQRRLGQGWNTWDVNSVTTQVLLPRGLAMNHNTTEYSDSYLENTLIGRLSADM